MSTIKSYAVGNGDMFYIDHHSDSFTIIDCRLSDENRDSILSEIKTLRRKKGIARFISTHPDEDHICGLEDLESCVGIENFYCVRNAATKAEETASFAKYCELRNDSSKVFHISKGCSRKWMNLPDEERGSAGISVLWPDLTNAHFKAALSEAEAGFSPNNISAVIQYSVEGGVSVLWMGDLDADYMEEIEDDLALSPIHILFAPHHGRDSGKVPASMHAVMSPKIIVVGEAPSEHLHYYPDYNTITQNLAGDIVFSCEQAKVHVFTSRQYDVDFLDDESMSFGGMYYVGTLNL